MPSSTNADAVMWRFKAEEARTFAELMTDPQARAVMRKVAEGYEHLADLVEKPLGFTRLKPDDSNTGQ